MVALNEARRQSAEEMTPWLKRLFFGAAWRLYQIALIAAGLLVSRYWIFNDMMSSDKLPSLVVTAVFGSLLFAYGTTILTTRCLDYFRSGNKSSLASSVAIAPEEGQSDARRRPSRVNRPEAIRRLVEQALKTKK